MNGTDELGRQLADAIRRGVTAAMGHPDPEDKKSKDETNYGTPADEEEGTCGECRHFDAPDSCNLVQGDIDESDVCDLYKPRRAFVQRLSVSRGQ